MKLFSILLFLIATIFISSCDSNPSSSNLAKNNNTTKEEAHHHGKGIHGGTILDSGAGLHLEVIHDQNNGKISLYVLGKDENTPQKISEPPLLNLKTSDGPKQLQTKPSTSQNENDFFELSDSLLKNHLKGRIVVVFQSKRYNFDLEDSHDHGDHGHGGHGHGDHADHSDHGHEHAENSISHTAWTKQCEWFVELETPQEGKSVSFATHITLLNDFSPAKKGKFTAVATFGAEKISTQAEKPARDGIYTPSITFPKSGKWNLQLAYQLDTNVVDTIQYEIEVYPVGKIPQEKEEDNAISFLKEQQWKISFQTTNPSQSVIASVPNAIAIPNKAIVQDKGETFVLVQREGESFEKRKVNTGKEENNWIEIQNGLALNERIVIQGIQNVLNAEKK